MTPPRTIVVATDLSPAAAMAFPYAAGFALPNNARVVLVHVDELIDLGFHSSSELEEHLDRITQARQERLVLAEQTLRSFGVDVQVETHEGAPDREILGVAEEVEADLIVVAKQGARKLEHFLLGSTTKRLVRQSKIPMLVVPSPPDTMPQSVPATYRRIVATTDFSEDSRRGVSVTAKLSEALDASLTLLHVLRLPTVISPIPGESLFLVPNELRGKMERDAYAELTRWSQQLPTKRAEAQVLIGFGVAEEITEYADKSADLLVIPAHGKSTLGAIFLGSTAEEVIKRARKPVLFLPHAYLAGLPSDEIPISASSPTRA